MTLQLITQRFLTPEVAAIAAQMALDATIYNPAVAHMFPKKAGHLVMAVLSVPDGVDLDDPDWIKQPSKYVLVHDQSYNRELWTGSYDKYARGKLLQLVHGRNGDHHGVTPHLIVRGDVLYYGGAKRSGVAAAFSGEKSYWDKAIAGSAIEFAIALAHGEYMDSHEKADGIPFAQ